MVGMDPIHLTVTPIFPLAHGRSPMLCQLGMATGFFFYQNSGKKFLITNRHVAIQESKGHYPDSFFIIAHNNTQILSSVNRILIPLYDDNGIPLWYEHPHMKEVDIVALSLDSLLDGTEVIRFITKRHIPTSGYSLGIGSDVLIIGYPLGFYDTKHYLPIPRSGTLASKYGIAFEGQAFFLIDATLHEGMSGSPVIIPMELSEKGEPPQTAVLEFLGIYSGNFERFGIDLGLGQVWYSELVTEIVNSQTQGSIRT